MASKSTETHMKLFFRMLRFMESLRAGCKGGR